MLLSAPFLYSQRYFTKHPHFTKHPLDQLFLGVRFGQAPHETSITKISAQK